MGWWSRRVVPRLVHASLSQPPVMRERRTACAGLGGRVLEVGFGSGLNLAVLPPEVTALDAVEPSDVAWRRSAPGRDRAALPVGRIGLDGQQIDADDAAYDAVLCTFALCTIPDAERTLREIRRVLRPGGRLHLLEHGVAPDPGVRRLQRRLEPLQRALFDGCHLTRDPVASAGRTGFAVSALDQHYLPGTPRPWAYLTRATLVPAPAPD